MGVSLPERSTTLADVGLPEAGSWPAGRERVLPGTRAWFLFFLVWMTGWAVIALYSLHLYDTRGADGALRVWVLALACFYLSLCNAFFPLPTTWIVMLAATDQAGLAVAPGVRVLLVSVLAACATVVANLNEYHLLAYLLHFGLGQRVRRTRLYGRAARWFDRAPFQLLVLIAFIPLPIDAVRWLAILRTYARARFAVAYFVGRWLRYLILAGGSLLLNLSTAQVLLIQGALVAGAFATRLGLYVLRRARPVPDATAR